MRTVAEGKQFVTTVWVYHHLASGWEPFEHKPNESLKNSLEFGGKKYMQESRWDVMEGNSYYTEIDEE